MKAKLERDRQRRLWFSIYEDQRRKLKADLLNVKIPEERKEKLVRKLRELPRNSSKTRIRNRCVSTGRGRAVDRLFKLSRIALRRKANEGQIPGLKKASW